MKRLKLLSLTFAISVSTMIYAEKRTGIFDLNALSVQVEFLLQDAHQTIDEGETITLFFSISECKTIQFLNVASTDRTISELLQEKLQHQRLNGEKWREGKIYELSIEGRKSSRTFVSHQ